MIDTLHADFNSVVKSGQIVATIDPFPYRARRDQAAATLANAKAAVVKARVDLSQRKRELDRAQSLIKDQFVSQNDLDMAVTAHEGAIAQLAVAEAAVKQAEAALEAAELDLKYTVIRSPVDGVVISRLVEVGQRVSATFSIPTLFFIAQDLTQMQVDTNVSESDIGGMAVGKAAAFTVDAYPGEQFHGVVKQVRNAPISIQNVVTYNVVVGVENRDQRLKPGMTANVAIVVARQDDALKIPNAALRFTPPPGGAAQGANAAGPPLRAGSGSDSGPMKRVWRLGTAGDPEPVPVKTGISDGVVTELSGGELKEGDEVVVGLEAPRTGRRPDSLPPGFGSGSPRRTRDRGI
jgi:HlyD family secretion protein